jgi:putative flavoprotein involved in K+ transport
MTAKQRRVERYELVVIGGGQAGLAAGYWLSQHDIDFAILDGNARVGDAWRQRWDSLRLFTPARYSALPGMPFPAAPYHLPNKNEVADYLEWYAKVFELPVRNGVRVSGVQRSEWGFEIETNDVRFEAENVVVATGPFHTPHIPAFAAELDPNITQLHSSQYRGPSQLRPGGVLVVGAGNSGAQIALEIAQTREVTLAGRSVGTLRRRVLGRDVFDWLSWTVMRFVADTPLGRRIRRNVLTSSDALIGMTEGDLNRAGVRRTGRVDGVREGLPTIDGSTLDVTNVIWSTGFRPDFRWIDFPIFNNDGFPQHTRGVTTVPGLYFLGLRFLHRLNSSLLGGVGADAKHVADVIAARYGHTREKIAAPHYSKEVAIAF